MCNFFSLVSDGKGGIFYMSAKERKNVELRKKYSNMDSHTSIADYHGFKGSAEDKLNKYEYNPLTKIFVVDQMNTTDDHEAVEAFCRALDFKTIVSELIIKPIIHPFRDVKPIKKVTTKHLALLKKWASAWASVSASTERNSAVWASAWNSVCASVWASAWNSVCASVWASVWASAGASAGASVCASVRDSVVAYTSSFFDIEYKHDFSSAVKLWESGLIPSFDGDEWRLHTGPDGKEIWKGKV